MDNSTTCTGCSFSSGGGLYITRLATGPSSIDLSTFEGNQAWFGSGISSETSAQLTLTRSTFTNNGHPTYCGYGGGVAAGWVDGDQLLFQGNVVVNAGGAVDATTATLRRSSFITNSVTAGGGGGGVYAYRNFTGINLVFVSNTATNGAALRVVNGPATLWHVTIARTSSRAAGQPSMLMQPARSI